MSAVFNGSSDRINGSTFDLSFNSPPFTVSAWFYPTAAMNQGAIAAVRDAQTPYNDYGVLLGQPDGTVRWQVADGSAVWAVTTTSASLNTWNHAVGIETSTSSRSVYLNGGGKGTNTTFKSFNAIDSHSIGAVYINRGPASWGNWFQGRVAEVGMWNVALSEAEVQSLAIGMSPLFIRPASLVHYWPLGGITKSIVSDVMTGNTLGVAGSPTLGEHSPAIYGTAPLAVLSGEGGGGGGGGGGGTPFDGIIGMSRGSFRFQRSFRRF